MDIKEYHRQVWSRLHPTTRCSLRNLYRCMREVSKLDRFTATAYVSWAAGTADTQRIMTQCSDA